MGGELMSVDEGLGHAVGVDGDDSPSPGQSARGTLQIQVHMPSTPAFFNSRPGRLGDLGARASYTVIGAGRARGGGDGDLGLCRRWPSPGSGTSRLKPNGGVGVWIGPEDVAKTGWVGTAVAVAVADGRLVGAMVGALVGAWVGALVAVGVGALVGRGKASIGWEDKNGRGCTWDRKPDHFVKG